MATEESRSIESPKSDNEEKINPYGYEDLYSLPKDYSLDAAKKNKDIIWTHEDVYNLERLDNFMINVQNETKDMIRIVCFTKEGDPIIQDVEYNGLLINQLIDSTRDEFSENPSIDNFDFQEISIKNRYDEVYKGTFTEYVLKNTDSDTTITILQVFEKD